MRYPSVSAWTVLLLIAAACGGGSGSSDSSTPTTATPTTLGLPGAIPIGPQGGVVTSDDGLLSVEIPAGALAGTQPVAIDVADPETFGLGDGSLAVYDLQPDGLGFSEPAVIELRLSPLEMGIAEDEVPFVFLFHGSPAGWEPLDTVSSRDESGDVIVGAEITHFSSLTAVVSRQVFDHPVTLAMRPTKFAASLGGIALIDYSWRASGPLRIDERIETAVTGAIVEFVSSEDSGLLARCDTKEGTGTYQLTVQFDVEQIDNASEYMKALFFASGPRTSFSLSAVGVGTCFKPDNALGPSFVSGSWRGEGTLDDLLKGDSFGANYGLTYQLPEGSAPVGTPVPGDSQVSFRTEQRPFNQYTWGWVDLRTGLTYTQNDPDEPFTEISVGQLEMISDSEGRFTALFLGVDDGLRGELDKMLAEAFPELFTLDLSGLLVPIPGLAEVPSLTGPDGLFTNADFESDRFPFALVLTANLVSE